jgi:hypothetical protein
LDLREKLIFVADWGDVSVTAALPGGGMAFSSSLPVWSSTRKSFEGLNGLSSSWADPEVCGGGVWLGDVDCCEALGATFGAMMLVCLSIGARPPLLPVAGVQDMLLK